MKNKKFEETNTLCRGSIPFLALPISNLFIEGACKMHDKAEKLMLDMIDCAVRE